MLPEHYVATTYYGCRDASGEGEVGVRAGLRPDEAAALRWRHRDPSVQPLGKLLVAASYNTREHRAKGTKTDDVHHVPVHPTLAAMLAECRLSGWAAMLGRQPEADDLIVPLPPAPRRRAIADWRRLQRPRLHG